MVFSGGKGKEASRDVEVVELYAKIGQLTVKVIFITAVLAMNRAERLAMLDRG